MFTPINSKNLSKKSITRVIPEKSSTATNSTSTLDETQFSHALETEMERSHQTSKTNYDSPPSWEEISDLIGDLETQGHSLVQLPSLENFYQYRNLLQKILVKIIPQSLVIQKEYSLNTKSMTQKEFHLVTGVNRELNSLLKMIDSNQKNNFIMANQVVSIKGLIVDFYS